MKNLQILYLSRVMSKTSDRKGGQSAGGRKRGFNKAKQRNMTMSHADERERGHESGSAAESFSGPVGVIEVKGDSGDSDGQGGDMSDGIEVFRAIAVMDPKSGLTGILEAGVIAFTFGAEGVGALEGSAGSVDGKSVIIGYGDVFCTAAVLLTIVPILVIARTLTGLGLAEGAAELLAGTTIIGCLAILVHGETGLTKEVSGRQFGGILSVSPVEWDNSFALVNIADSVVYGLGVITLVGDKGTFLDRDDLVGSLEDVQSDGGIGDIGRRGDLVNGQA